ncbi:MAG: LacI family DNA-binding transcriptional regulator [Ardenticatenaceae bacterium]|nr:LacI family DNA-binding transcriptional regulator [Ardenticatenaceae bacterium]MCB9445903.1 LacI family DNA-binding transcriptional regulator [Ardenticatenaceae bacterium]
MAKRSKANKTTIVDIAEASGVSVATVSRIINNKPDVAEKTRQRVLKLMEERGFAPQIPWQQLRSGKSPFIALNFPQDFNPPSQGIITAAALGCENADYSLNLIAKSLGANDLLTIYRSGQSDGMILMEILLHDQRVELLKEHDLPFVMIGRCADNACLDFVDINIEKGVADAMQHLYDLGHRQIGFVTLVPVLKEKEYGYTTWAVKGYEQACQKHGLPFLWRVVDLNTDNAQSIVRVLLDENPEMTAIVTPQQSGVLGVLKAIQEKGLRIPEDISVIGLLSDSIGELITPPLTTISFPAEDLGREAARILIGHLEGTLSKPQQVLLRPELVVRGSTGPAPSR